MDMPCGLWLVACTCTPTSAVFFSMFFFTHHMCTADTYIHTYMQTYIQTIPTNIHTYLYIYKHIYIYINIQYIMYIYIYKYTYDHCHCLIHLFDFVFSLFYLCACLLSQPSFEKPETLRTTTMDGTR